MSKLVVEPDLSDSVYVAYALGPLIFWVTMHPALKRGNDLGLAQTKAAWSAYDISKSHIWDISSVAALDSVISKFRRQGVEVEVIGLNRASATLVDHISLHDHGDRSS